VTDRLHTIPYGPQTFSAHQSLATTVGTERITAIRIINTTYEPVLQVHSYCNILSMSLTALARRRSDSMYAVCENFLDLDSTRIQMDAWGYTSKPF